jgi:hypothetical protein
MNTDQCRRDNSSRSLRPRTLTPALSLGQSSQVESSLPAEGEGDDQSPICVHPRASAVPISSRLCASAPLWFILFTLAACSDSGSRPSETATTERLHERDATTVQDAAEVGESEGEGKRHTIATNTQMHLDGAAIGVGNIWEEEYTPAGESLPRRGLTAALFITVKDDTSKNVQRRFHPGEEVSVPGYRVRVVSVDEKSVELEIVDVKE